MCVCTQPGPRYTCTCTPTDAVQRWEAGSPQLPLSPSCHFHDSGRNCAVQYRSILIHATLVEQDFYILSVNKVSCGAHIFCIGHSVRDLQGSGPLLRGLLCFPLDDGSGSLQMSREDVDGRSRRGSCRRVLRLLVFWSGRTVQWIVRLESSVCLNYADVVSFCAMH